MKIVQGEWYRPSEMTGEAEPTMTSPITHRTPTSVAMDRADRRRDPRPARFAVVAGATRARRADVAFEPAAGRGRDLVAELEGCRPRVTVRAAEFRSATPA